MSTAAQSSGAVFRFGVFEVDVRAGELRKGGVRVKLQEQPWQVLLSLLENAGNVVTREELRERLWPKDTFVDFDHSLNIAVNKIRDALDDVAASPRFVETVPRRGYRFLAPVERIPTDRAGGAAISTDRTALKWIKRLAIVGAALLVVAAVLGFSASRLTRLAPPRHAIAVLPLKNLSAEPGTDYFSDGLTDQIIHDLSLIDGLEVKSRASSFEFKDKGVNIRDAGKQLGADLVLEGSVLRAGGRLRLNIALVRVADDVTIWAQRYDREMNDVFAIQDEISRSIVNELRLKSVGGQRRYNPNLEAYDLYLRATSLANENSPGQGPSLQRAIELLDQVTAKEPQFAPAWAEIADAYAHLRNRGRSVESGHRMRQAARRAVALDPLLPEANATLGLVHASDLRWQDAEAAFRRALELNPNMARAREDFALFVLQPEGKLTEALEQLRKAVDLDPLSSSRRKQLAFALLRTGANEEALELAQPIFAANPADGFAGQLYARALMNAGKPHQALAILEGLDIGSLGYIGYAYAKLGRRREAEVLAARSDAAVARHQVLIYAALGDGERCIEALRTLARLDDFMADLYPGEPELASLRSDPRMREFRRQRGLPENP